MNDIRNSYYRALSNSNQMINDTRDGSIYKRFIQNNQPGSNTFIVSLIVNSDGAPILASKNTSMWPVLAKIVELHDKTSESFENLIIIGLWLNEEKPNYEIYLSKCTDRILDAIHFLSKEKIGK
jgi:hypothetical protein